MDNDPALHARVVDEVTAAAEVGLKRLGLVDSPDYGSRGKQGVLLHPKA